MKKFIISIDAGTTSNRSILFDLKGKPVYSSQKEFTQYFPKSGWVEHNPDEIWRTTIKTLKDVDKKGIKIAVAERSAYDLWLTENIKNADLIRAKSIDESFAIFQENKYEVLAGLRPKLVEEIKKTTDCFILNQPFTYINQCIGSKPGNLEAENFINNFVKKNVENGFVKNLLSKYCVLGKLSLPKN